MINDNTMLSITEATQYLDPGLELTFKYAIVIAIATFIAAFLIMLFVHYKSKKWMRVIPIVGIFVSSAVAHFPIFLYHSGEIYFAVLNSIIRAIKIFFLTKLDYYDIMLMLPTELGDLIYVYQIVFWVLVIAAPLCTALVLISYVSDWLSLLRIHAPLSISDRYVFSDMNEKTYTLAHSMIENNIHGYYIFAGIKRDARKINPYYEDVKKMGCTVIASHIIDIHRSIFGKTHYFIFSDNGTKNIDIALKMMEKHTSKKSVDIDKDGCSNISISVMSNEIEAEYLLDNKSKELMDDERYSKLINVRLINENQQMAYGLLSDNPLYNVLSAGKKQVIEFLLIGGGYTGLEILKNALWCSCSDKYTFKATVIDKDIKRSKALFKRSCPYIYDTKGLDIDINVEFYHENIFAETSSLIDFIESKNAVYNYIVIATDNEEINIRAALDIKTAYLRLDRKDVQISVVVRDEMKYNLLKENTKMSDDVVIFPFGSNVRMYSYDRIVNNSLEKMAIRINWIYSKIYNRFIGNATDTENNYSKALNAWNKLNLQKKRSSTAHAVFVRYVLRMSGCSIAEINNAVDCGTVSQKKCIIPESEIEEYARQEHKRWNIYSLIEGYKPWDCDDALSHPVNKKRIEYLLKTYGNDYSKSEVSQKCLEELGLGVFINDELKHQHACITNWDNLIRIDNTLATCYVEYDMEFIRNIYEIIGLLNDMYEF